MTLLDDLLDRNKAGISDAGAAGAGQPSLSDGLLKVRAIIIGCADMRVDPAHVLGIKPGEAVVMRNIGGRVSPSLLEQMGLLGRIGEVEQKVPGGGGEFHLIVLQHTDCGIKRLAGDSAKLAAYLGVDQNDLNSKHVLAPRDAVAADVATLRGINVLPAEWIISGLVYDIADGHIDVVVPPAPIGRA